MKKLAIGSVFVMLLCLAVSAQITGSFRSVNGPAHWFDKNIKFIAQVYPGWIIAAGDTGSYDYQCDDSSPTYSSSAVSFVKTYCLFTYGNGQTMIGKKGYIVNSMSGDEIWYEPSGTAVTPLNYPYWLVGNLINQRNQIMYLVTTNPTGFAESYGGGWSTDFNQPAAFYNANILSVSSGGLLLYMATSTSLFYYDFMGTWKSIPFAYSPYRYVAADKMMPPIQQRVWIADSGLGRRCDVYCYDILNTQYVAPVPFPQQYAQLNKPYCIYVDYNFTVWVGTSNGAYYLNRKNGPQIWQAVPLRTATGAHTLAGDTVYSVYVDSAKNSVWLGTNNGLTVWHRGIPVAVEPITKSAKNIFANIFSKNTECFDIRGRKITPAETRGQIYFIRQTNRILKQMNINAAH
jgi:hypothetical protein